MTEDRWPGYGAPKQEMPLGGYLVLLAVWATGAVAALIGLSRSGRDRRTPAPFDIVLLGLATHKLTRIVTKDWVTAPLRAPFVEYQHSAGAGEVVERARGTGLRKAIGDLLTCPFCTGPWVGGTLLVAWAALPRPTRIIASLFSAVAISDFLHRSYGLIGASARSIEEG